MGKREKREHHRAERLAAEAKREAEHRDRWRREILAQRCPSCDSGEVSRFLYGLPDLAALREEIDSGLVVLAGSSFGASDPLWVCRQCRHKWGTLAEILDASPRATADPVSGGIKGSQLGGQSAENRR